MRSLLRPRCINPSASLCWLEVIVVTIRQTFRCGDSLPAAARSSAAYRETAPCHRHGRSKFAALATRETPQQLQRLSRRLIRSLCSSQSGRAAVRPIQGRSRKPRKTRGRRRTGADLPQARSSEDLGCSCWPKSGGAHDYRSCDRALAFDDRKDAAQRQQH